MSFNEQFDLHAAWRREFAARLKTLGEWLKSHDLLDAAVEERLQKLESQVRTDKVMVAFVAEFSRGKSELINAIFFAGYGRRIMPASAGRTTMCPTELGYDAEIPPCLRLLPIETRLQPQALMEWRMVPEKWRRIDLDVNDPAQLAQALEKVSEVRHVTQNEARALGFWHDNNLQDNPPLAADGSVEVPRWRHALINIAHPLLKQGLVILDTPGLNAIGAEPELTMSLIPQAQAVIFILAADTGVTKSDLTIWNEHLSGMEQPIESRLVVLNKIDSLWDPLSTTAQIQAQIDRQKEVSAKILGLPVSQVIAVSAQKGLVAKVTADESLLAASQLPLLEQALSQGLLGQRQKILQAAVAGGIAELKVQTSRAMGIRRRDLAEQLDELRGLKGKNSTVIRHMRSRIMQEQTDFNTSGAKIFAVRSIHLKLLQEVLSLLSTPTLKSELESLTLALQRSGVKLGVKKAYSQTFTRLRECLQKAGGINADIQLMLNSSFRQLNADFGFSLVAPREPEMETHEQDLNSIERSHLQYLGIGNLLRLHQAEFSDQLVRALSSRLRGVFETALTEIELWNKSAAAQLDAQLREKRRNFERRLEAIERIQQAASGLNERIDEIDEHETRLDLLDLKLAELSSLVLSRSQQQQTKAVNGAGELATLS